MWHALSSTFSCKSILSGLWQTDVLLDAVRPMAEAHVSLSCDRHHSTTQYLLTCHVLAPPAQIRVFCRVRPHPSSAVRCLPGNTSLALNVDGKEHTFGFDRVFSPSDSQANIFSEVAELVQSALDGYHVCLFSYGQTGAGKTFTMQGTPDEQGRGIIPRAVEQLLEAVERLGDQEWAYTLEASFIEVYNNQLR